MQATPLNIFNCVRVDGQELLVNPVGAVVAHEIEEVDDVEDIDNDLEWDDMVDSAGVEFGEKGNDGNVFQTNYFQQRMMDGRDDGQLVHY